MPPRPRSSALPLLSLLVLLAAACDGGGVPLTPDPEPDPGPTPPVEHTVEVFRSSGVVGAPAAGTRTARAGDTVAYAFAAASGYEGLQVLLDTLPVPAEGTFVVDTSRVLRAVAFPVPDPPAGPLAGAVTRIYSEGSVDAFREVMSLAARAALSGDEALLDDLRRAEYAALLAAGPEGLRRITEALAGLTIPLVGDPSERPASRLVGGPGSPSALFAEDTVVPTTVILVNGVLNTSGMATGSAHELVRVLQEAGFDGATFAASPGGARPGSSLQVYLHFNPIVSVQSPLVACVLSAAWALNVAGLADPNSGDRSVAERAWGLLRRAALLGECGVAYSTNLRVVMQFLDANLGDLARPDVNDTRLILLVGAERSRGGGRNVIVAGHSHGSIIARTGVGAAGARGANRGCLGALALGSPLGTSVAWPNQEWLARIIARGTEDFSHDILFPLGPGRTDGRSSGQTARLDADIRAGGWGLPWIFRQLSLHSLVGSYLATDGHRGQVAAALREGYGALADACGGAFTGEVRDFETGDPIPGATVTLRVAGRERESATTDGSGRFETARLRPLLHEVIVAAEGFRSDTLHQRLIPFDATVPVQEGPIYLGRECEREGEEVCDVTGRYAGYYHLSGARGGLPVACSFHAMLELTQNGRTVSGTVWTDRYQRGCDAGTDFIHWGVGSWPLSGTIEGDRIALQHPAIPPFQLTGRAHAGGFQVTEPTWLPGGDYRLRVEISARRVDGDPVREGRPPPPAPGGTPLGAGGS